MSNDIDYRNREAHGERILRAAIPSELKRNMIPESRMGFSELYECLLLPDHYVVTTIDGPGSKVHLASAMGKYDTIGIDLVHANGNDFAAHPANGRAMPFLFLDYLACQDKILEEGITGNIMKGIVKGLNECDIADILQVPVRLNLGKGETASMQDTVGGPRHGYGFDMSGAMVGFLEKGMFLTSQPRDLIVALPSSSGHTNGYTDLKIFLLNGDFEERPEVRQKYRGRFHLDDRLPEGGLTIGEALLEPTRGYMKLMATLHKRGIKAIGINISGFGLHNCNRVGYDVRYVIHSPLEMHPLFKLVQEESGLSDYEIYRRFNGGMGFLIITKPSDADEIMKVSQEHNMPANVVGEVKKYTEEPSTVLIKGGKEILFKGYG